jgi:murein DD-endopeptidase MepM/ murein hydrolase activator NlpD
MNIILVGKRHGQSKNIKLKSRHLIVGLVLLFSTLVGLVVLGFKMTQWLDAEKADFMLSRVVLEEWRRELSDQRKEVDGVARLSSQQLNALTLMMGDMQARLYRLDALGVRLTEVAKLKNGEFDFTSAPSIGGPEASELDAPFQLNEFEIELERLSAKIDDREQQLAIMEQLFVQDSLDKESFIAGRPIGWGWMSSPYGYRSDPFSGKRAWHGGVDFAGKDGSDIVAVAAGVVTWSGDRYGYGNLVEINHGSGYATRYAHCKELLVDVGTVVQKGQVIARMGSTGRSTGPHVHYEVLRKGKAVDPKKYIYRASK